MKKRPFIQLQPFEPFGVADCGCRLMGDTNKTETAIFLCPLHDAAKDLLAVLKEVAEDRNFVVHGSITLQKIVTKTIAKAEASK